MSRQSNRAQGWLASIVLGLACATVAVAQEDTVVTANQGSGTVSVFDTVRNAVKFNINAGFLAPTEIALRPHINPSAYTTNQLGGSVGVVDVIAGGVRTEIPISFPYPFGLSITPDGHRAAVGNSESFFGIGAVAEPGVANITDFNPATFNLVSIVDLDRDVEERVIDVGALGGGGAGPVDVAYSPSGDRLYILNTLTDSVDIVDTTTFTRIATVLLPLAGTQFGLQLAVSYDNAFVYVVAFDFGGGATGALIAFDVPTLTTVAIPLLNLGVNANPTDVWFNRESTLAYVADAANNQVQVISVAAQAFLLFVAGTQPGGMSRGCLNDDLPNVRFGYVSNPVEDQINPFNAASNVWGVDITLAVPAPPAADPIGIAVVAIQRLNAAAAAFDQRVRERREERGSGLCFVATASYGNTDEVASLRAFRDLYLMPTKFGRSFVDLYYGSSPGVATMISGREDVRTAVRGGLTPVVWVVGLVTGSGGLLPGVMGVVLVLAAGVAARRFFLARARQTA